MAGIVILIAVVAFAAMGYWLVQRRRLAPDRHSERDKASVPGRTAKASKRSAAPRYGAVEIQVRQSSCAAAHVLRGRRYLTEEAPTLPLPGCTAAQCSCAFVKYSDRRTDDRRLEQSGLSASLYLASDRREHDGRRDGD